MNPFTRWSVLAGCLMAAFLVMLETSLSLFFNFPALAPLPADLMREIYAREYRGDLHFDPDCAQYDPVLTYRLKRGRCQFENFEFSTTVGANALGLRDSQIALAGPQVIFLGDSVTMGWGVQDSETFSELYEETTGLPVLNAGVPSYGTPRELLLLERLDVLNLKALVVQYSPDDAVETREFARNETLTPATEADYLDAVANRQARIDYFPGRHTLVALGYVWRGLSGSLAVAADPVPIKAEVDYLVASLNTLRGLPQGVRYYLFEFSGCGEQRPAFAAELASALADQPAGSTAGRFKVLDLNSVLEPGMCFPMDGHPNAQGHATLARALASMTR